MKFLIDGLSIDVDRPGAEWLLLTLAASVKWGWRITTAPPKFVLAQIESALRWMAGDRYWYR